MSIFYQAIYIYIFKYIISVKKSLWGIGMVMYMTMLMCLVLCGIDLLRCCCCDRASTETYYCDTSTTCCCEHVRNTAAAHITYIAYMNHPVADLYRWSWGRRRVSEVRCKLLQASTSHIFECWAVNSLATHTRENQSAVPCDNDVIMSDWVKPIGLHQFHARTLYIYIYIY